MPGEMPDPTVRGRIEEQILGLLAVRAGTIAFNGIRRALQVHPESLARALRRLERDARIVHGPQGYLLADPPVRRQPVRPAPRTVASVELPASIDASELYGRLAGRWMGRLRWVGVEEPDGRPWLVWSVSEPSARVLLTFHGRTLQVHADGGVDDPRLDDAALTLLSRALELLPRPGAARGPGGRGRTAFAPEAVWDEPN